MATKTKPVVANLIFARHVSGYSYAVEMHLCQALSKILGPGCSVGIDHKAQLTVYSTTGGQSISEMNGFINGYLASVDDRMRV